MPGEAAPACRRHGRYTDFMRGAQNPHGNDMRLSPFIGRLTMKRMVGPCSMQS
jgi:hypothetical protein